MKKHKHPDWDFISDSQQSQEIIKLVEKYLTKNYGDQCEKMSAGCIVCSVWSAWTTMKSLMV